METHIYILTKVKKKKLEMCTEDILLITLGKSKDTGIENKDQRGF